MEPPDNSHSDEVSKEDYRDQDESHEGGVHGKKKWKMSNTSKPSKLSATASEWRPCFPTVPQMQPATPQIQPTVMPYPVSYAPYAMYPGMLMPTQSPKEDSTYHKGTLYL